VQHYLPKLLKLIEEGKIDPSFVITHTAPLEKGPELYQTFRDKKDGCIKVVLARLSPPPQKKATPSRGDVSALSCELKTCTPATYSAWASGHFSAQTGRRGSSARCRGNAYG